MRSSGDFPGNHVLDGILAAIGPDIPAGPITDARLLDIAPTILHALDLPLPPDLDGMPLWSQPQDVKWSDADEAPSSGLNADEVLNAEETATVEQCLRSLGYL